MPRDYSWARRILRRRAAENCAPALDQSGGNVREKLSGAGRRGPGLGEFGRKPEVREDLANDAGVLDGRDQAHAAATAGAGKRANALRDVIYIVFASHAIPTAAFQNTRAPHSKN